MKESDCILLLSKRLSGDITPEENNRLDEWLRQSPENQRFANETQRIWEKAEGYGKAFSPDLDADFKKVQARLRAGAPAQLRVSFSQRLMRVAAVAALLVAALWSWQHFAPASSTEIMVSAETLGPKPLDLPDGSKCWLREGSQLIYSSRWNTSERQVKLRGEGYFEVTHDPAHPFKVILEQGGFVEVMGTQFDVCQVGNASSVLVRSGKVRFSPTAQSAGPVLTANQKAIYDPASAQVKVLTLHSLNELSWQTGGLQFVNTPLTQVLSDLEHYYGVKIALHNSALSNCPYTAPLTSQSIEKVLESLALTFELKLRKTGEKAFELIGGTCG